MTDAATLRVERPETGVAVLRLDRPKQLNALTAAMFTDLRDACARLREDEDVRAVVLTGAGRGFCAGYDLDEAQELATLSPRAMLARQDSAHVAISALRALPQPVVAAVGGAAIGGGLSLALAADIRVASPAARFSAAFVRLGLSGGDMGCSWHLPRVVGAGVAADLMLTGRTIDAAEALRIGLVSQLADDGAGLEALALETARAIAGHSSFGVTLTKRALYANLDAPSLATALEVEARGQAFATRDEGFTDALRAVRARFVARS